MHTMSAGEMRILLCTGAIDKCPCEYLETCLWLLRSLPLPYYTFIRRFCLRGSAALQSRDATRRTASLLQKVSGWREAPESESLSKGSNHRRESLAFLQHLFPQLLIRFNRRRKSTKSLHSIAAKLCPLQTYALNCSCSPAEQSSLQLSCTGCRQSPAASLLHLCCISAASLQRDAQGCHVLS